MSPDLVIGEPLAPAEHSNGSYASQRPDKRRNVGQNQSMMESIFAVMCLFLLMNIVIIVYFANFSPFKFLLSSHIGDSPSLFPTLAPSIIPPSLSPPSAPRNPKGQNPNEKSQGKTQLRDSTSYFWASDDSEIMKRIIEHQFPKSCDGKKFIVFRLGKTRSRNIGSVSRHASHWLGEALISGRILVWGDEPWKMADCEFKSWNCYFKPISSCTYEDIPEKYIQNATEIHDDIDDLGDSKHANLPVVYAWRLWYRTKIGDIQKFLKIDGIKFRAYAQVFLLRQNNEIKQIVTDRLGKLMDLYPDLEPEKTVSMPMRRGDKCRGHHISGSSAGEDTCLTLDTWVKAIDRFRCEKFECDQGKLSNFIVTSGEKAVVINMTALGPQHGWNVIWNQFDVMQGTGSADDLQHFNNTLTTRDVMISVFTSLQLQLRAKFFVKKKRRHYSSWITLIETIVTLVTDTSCSK